MPPQQRADARRNYARLLEVAVKAVADQGADASLEQIARDAGVGSGTVRRHFPTRHTLLEAVFRDQVDGLVTHGAALARSDTPRAALVEWLSAVTVYAATFRGLAEALARDPGGHEYCATGRLTEVGATLVRRASESLAPAVTIGELLDLITGIALVAWRHDNPAAEAQRLLDLALSGVVGSMRTV